MDWVRYPDLPDPIKSAAALQYQQEVFLFGNWIHKEIENGPTVPIFVMDMTRNSLSDLEWQPIPDQRMEKRYVVAVDKPSQNSHIAVILMRKFVMLFNMHEKVWVKRVEHKMKFGIHFGFHVNLWGLSKASSTLVIGASGKTYTVDYDDVDQVSKLLSRSGYPKGMD